MGLSLHTPAPEGLDPLPAPAVAVAGDWVMTTVGDGTVTVLGMVWVEVLGVGRGVMVTVLVMLGIVTLLTAEVAVEAAAAGLVVAPRAESSVVAEGELSVIALAAGTEA